MLALAALVLVSLGFFKSLDAIGFADIGGSSNSRKNSPVSERTWLYRDRRIGAGGPTRRAGEVCGMPRRTTFGLHWKLTGASELKATSVILLAKGLFRDAEVV